MAPVTLVALLRTRSDVPWTAVAEFAQHLLEALTQRGDRPALLWSERVDTLPAGVFTVARSAAIFPEALREAAGKAVLARFAHLGAGAEYVAAEALVSDLAPCTHALIDGRLLGVLEVHRSVALVGEGPGPWSPEAEALRARCDIELVDPGAVAAAALVRALPHGD